MPIPLKEKSILFAPMEGVTDSHYRQTINRLFPEWDYVATDFLRIPSVGSFSKKHFIKHIGEEVYSSKEMQKTIFQILVSERSLLSEHLEIINDLDIKWLDINLGCPSKTVCKNKGGSYLLSELDSLKRIIAQIRKSFKGTFTTKIRVGYQDDTLFESILKLLENEGSDAITIHARTRNELYKGVANWDYVKQAVQTVKLPIIGNGDIWSKDDIDKYYQYTGAHSVMIGRGALKTPWLAQLYYNDLEDSLSLRKEKMKIYFNSIYDNMKSIHEDEKVRIKRLKGLSRYIFDPYDPERNFKKSFLLSKSYDEMQSILNQL